MTSNRVQAGSDYTPLWLRRRFPLFSQPQSQTGMSVIPEVFINPPEHASGDVGKSTATLATAWADLGTLTRPSVPSVTSPFATAPPHPGKLGEW